MALFVLLLAACALAQSVMSSNCSFASPEGRVPEVCPYPSGAPVVPSGYLLPPNWLLDEPSPSYNNPAGHNLGTNEGRLVPLLRKYAAASGDRMGTLTAAALAILDGNATLGTAIADLSVTGRRNYACFAAASPRDAELVQLVRAADPGVSQEAVTEAAVAVLDRAYSVADALRQPSQSTVRQRLGWIALSGEDDLPYRPVNVPSSRFPQYDVTVDIPGPWLAPQSVATRYLVCQTRGGGTVPRGTNRTLPPAAIPVLAADAKVFLYVHGMDSRAEEAEQMCEALIAVGQRDGVNYALLAMDLPTSGYATHVNHSQLSPIDAIGRAKHFGVIPDFTDYGLHNVPLLEFVEQFVVSFVEAVDEEIVVSGGSVFSDHIVALVGGSLGGSMSLRFGRRTDLKWLRQIIGWSPASIWTSLADGADILKHQAPRTTWLNAGGDRSVIPEKPGDRAAFFAGVFDKPTSPVDPANPLMWYRDDWPCIKSAIVADRLDRLEMYDPLFRLWHWRLACEQLIYSHQQSNASASAELLYLHNVVPMALLCGTRDAWPYADICPTTQTVSARMVNTPGYAVYVHDTGHSIHNERPNFLASVMVDFIQTRSR
jgi:pimeloyl-ACP methyl ester carboxylesterase